MSTDAMEAVGHVRVTKRSLRNGKVVFDKVFKNKITDFARGQVATLWTGQVVPVPSKIAIGTGSNDAGPQASDSALWNEYSGTRKTVDFATTFLNFYTQYSVTYDQTEALASNMSSFNDLMTEYSGSSAANWTPNSGGSLTYGSNGVTLNNATAITSTVANNMQASSVGPVMAQATFTIPTVSPSNDFITLVQDGQNDYTFYLSGNTLNVGKLVAGTNTVLATSAALTLTVGSAYTIIASIDVSGNITANIYAGTSATGTALASLSVADTSLIGPFSLQVGGDASLVISNVQATYPNPDPTLQIAITEAGLFDSDGNLWSHVELNGVTHDNTTTLSVQWQVLQNGD